MSSDEDEDGEIQQELTCCICFESITPAKVAWMCHNCKYHYCRNDFVHCCFSTHRNNMPGVPTCPSCGDQPSYSQIRQVLQPLLWNRWTEQKSLATIRGDDQYIACPGLNCPIWYYNSCDEKVCRVDCVNCKTRFCTGCMGSWGDEHQTVCKRKREVSRDVQSWIDKAETDDAKRTRTCLKCQMVIIHTGGCKRMTCTHCGTDICWVCGLVTCICCGRCGQIPCICCRMCKRVDCICCKVCLSVECRCCQICHRYRECKCCKECGGDDRDFCSCCPDCKRLICECCKNCYKYECECCEDCDRKECICCDECGGEKGDDGCDCCLKCNKYKCECEK